MPARSPSGEGPSGGPTPAGRSFLEPTYGNAAVITDSADEAIRESDVMGTVDPEDAGVDAPDRVERKLGIGFWIAAGWIVVLLVLAISAPFITKGDESELIGILAEPNKGISSNPDVETNAPIGTAGNPLGTDALGRDLMSRVIWGARVSLFVGFVAVMVGLFFGGVIGLIAGYARGKTETFLMAFMDVLLAFPALILALAIVTFSDSRTLIVITMAIAIVAIPPLARLVRANTLVHGQREYVMAAKSIGAKNGRIITKEILPNVMRAVFSFAIIAVAGAIVAEGFLAFIGISIPPPDPTWGTMINEGRSDLEDAPWVTLVPAAALFMTVMALNLAGDRLREYFDVKEGGL